MTGHLEKEIYRKIPFSFHHIPLFFLYKQKMSDISAATERTVITMATKQGERHVQEQPKETEC